VNEELILATESEIVQAMVVQGMAFDRSRKTGRAEYQALWFESDGTAK
jgi:hypothetical protein